MSTENPDNSSVIQCLLDIEKAMAISDNPNAPDILKAVKTIHDNLAKSDIEHADGIFNAHRYGDRKLVFSKLARFRENQIIANLSASSLKILVYGIQIMSEDNCFLVRQSILAKTLKMSKQTITNGLTDLVDKGCILKICTLKRKNPSGTVYMIRSDIARIGVNDNELFFKEYAKDESLTYDKDKACEYVVIHATTRSGDRTIAFNYEDTVAPEKHQYVDYLHENTDEDT